MSDCSVTFRSNPGGSLQGDLRVPGDKSISHRAIMLAAIAEGTSEITGFLSADDCLATIQAFRAMRVEIEGPEQGFVRVHGVGLRGLTAPDGPLNLGNSGTSMRLMCGLLAGQKFDAILTGDESLSRRPMRRVTEPLRAMGAVITTTEAGTAPLKISGTAALHGIDYDMPVASAQVKSCLLLAGLYAAGETRIREPAPTRDHTERMLTSFGYAWHRDGSRITIAPGGRLRASQVDVPGDISSAAFFLVGAALAENSDLTLRHVGMNPTRTGVVEILRQMGANLEVMNPRMMGAEPVADLRVRASRLRGIAIPEGLVPLAIDEFPVLFVAAACAEGETVLSGAEELRVKESDRIQVMADGLQALGIEACPTPDGMRIRGGRLKGGIVDSHGDHRVAMAFSVAGVRAAGPIEIRHCRNVSTSFPMFIESARSVGLSVAAVEGDIL